MSISNFVNYFRVYKAYRTGRYLNLFEDIIDYGHELNDRSTHANETEVSSPKPLTNEQKNMYAWMVMNGQNNWILGRSINAVKYVEEMVGGIYNPRQTTMSEKIYPKKVAEKIYDDINVLAFPEKKVGIFKEDIFKNSVPCIRFVSLEETRIRCYMPLIPFNEPIKRIEWNEHIDGVREKLEEEIDHNKAEIEGNKGDIEENKAEIEENEQQIESNKLAIESNDKAIEGNEEAIGVNKVNIESNDDDIDNAEAEANTNQHLIGSSFGLMGGYVLVAFLLNTFRPNIPGPLQVVARIFTSAVGQVATGGESGSINMNDLKDLENGFQDQVLKLEGEMKAVHKEICEVRRRVRS